MAGLQVASHDPQGAYKRVSRRFTSLARVARAMGGRESKPAAAPAPSLQDAATNLDQKIEEIGLKIQKAEEEVGAFARRLKGVSRGEAVGRPARLAVLTEKKGAFQVRIPQPRHGPCRRSRASCLYMFCSFFSCALGKKLYEQQRDQLARGL